MSFKHIILGAKNQLKPLVIPVLQVKTEASMTIKNEPLGSEMIEIGVDDILDSSDIPDKKDIDIVYNSLCEGSIKSETVPENIFDSKHRESVETQISIQTENTPFIKTENRSRNETLIKSKDISDGNENRGTGQGALEIQVLTEQFNAVETNKQLLNHSKDLNGISARSRKAKHSKTTTSWRKGKEVIEAPVIPHSCDQCGYTAYTPSRLNVHKLIHLKPEESEYFYCCHCGFNSRYKGAVKIHMFERHYKNVGIKQKRFSCDRCDFKTHSSETLKRHNLIHVKREEIRYFYCSHCSFKTKHKYNLSSHILRRHCKNVEIEQKQKRFRCDHCDFKTQRRGNLKVHNLIHLNPEELQYFYCSHCSFKSKHKSSLRGHILRHFQNEEVKFCCYICDFMTLERELIIYHIKKHSKVPNKSKINEGN